MNSTIFPSFPNGMDTLCSLKSLLHQLDTFDVSTQAKLQERIASPFFEFGRMIQEQSRKMEQLDASHPKSAKIKEIWNRFIGDPDHSYVHKRAMENWVRSYEIGPSVNVSESFRSSALVIAAQRDPTDPMIQNLVSVEEYAQVQKLFDDFLSHVTIEGGEDFSKWVRQNLAFILAFEEGRRLIKAILQNGPTQLIIKQGENLFYGKTLPLIQLSMQAPVNVLQDPVTEEKRSYYDFFECVFFHELVHYLHFLKEGNDPVLSSLKIDPSRYTNCHEQRTILGTPSFNLIGENPYRKSRGSLERYGHGVGCNPKMPAEQSLDFAIRFNIDGDFKWIFSSLNKEQIDQVMQRNFESLSKNIPELKPKYKKFEKKFNQISKDKFPEMRPQFLLDVKIELNGFLPRIIENMLGLYACKFAYKELGSQKIAIPAISGSQVYPPVGTILAPPLLSQNENPQSQLDLPSSPRLPVQQRKRKLAFSSPLLSSKMGAGGKREAKFEIPPLDLLPMLPLPK